PPSCAAATLPAHRHAVTEGDMLEGDVAADRRESCPSGIEGWFRRGIEDIAEPRHRQAGLMRNLPDLGEPRPRAAHPSGQHIESNQLADREAAVDDELGAKKQDAGGDQLAHELHRLARHVAEAEQRNHMMSNRRERSTKPARRVISTRGPSHAASNSARVMLVGRGDNGDCTSPLPAPSIAGSKDTPLRSST